MSKGLIPIDGNMPSFMSGRRTGGSLTSARQDVHTPFATIGIKGKEWHIKSGGEDEIVTDPDTKRRVQYLDVAIVDVSTAISKTYYGTGFVEGERNAPSCASIDGVYPNPGVPDKQNPVCVTCPQNKFGSATGGRGGKACGDRRRIAVVPLYDIANERRGGPMLLDLPLMSMRSLRKYAEELERKGAPDIWAVGTRMEFESEAFPQIMFTAIGWVTEEQDQQIQALKADQADLINDMLYRAGPTESSDTIDNAPIPGTPPARAAQSSATITSLPPRRIEPAPRRVEPTPIEDESEVEAAPAAPAQAPAATRPQGRTSPFQAQQARTPSRPAARAAAQETPTAAPMDLESAIDDLFSSTGKSA